MKVLEVTGPKDAELQDEVVGYPSDATVAQALKEQLPALEAIYLEDVAEARKRMAGETAVEAFFGDIIDLDED